jgi:hypothetical protein
MKFWEAMKALQEGAKILSLPNSYMHIKDDELQFENGDRVILPISVFLNRDNFEIYQEPCVPQVKLTPEHVGRKVRLRNGDVAVIVSFWKEDSLFAAGGSHYACNGRKFPIDASELEIIEILPKD